MSDQNNDLVSPCPWLPVPERPIRAADSRALGAERGAQFYRLCLEYAQSKWMVKLPAQGILQLNKAFAADIDGSESELQNWPLPYQAMAWILEQRPDREEGVFLGNPRRHWQHYATRMSGPRSEIRTWRSWACWWLCEGRLPADEFPVDQLQIDEDGIVLPEIDQVAEALDQFGIRGEVGLWREQVST